MDRVEGATEDPDQTGADGEKRAEARSSAKLPLAKHDELLRSEPLEADGSSGM